MVVKLSSGQQILIKCYVLATVLVRCIKNQDMLPAPESLTVSSGEKGTEIISVQSVKCKCLCKCMAKKDTVLNTTN